MATTLTVCGDVTSMSWDDVKKSNDCWTMLEKLQVTCYNGDEVQRQLGDSPRLFIKEMSIIAHEARRDDVDNIWVILDFLQRRPVRVESLTLTWLPKPLDLCHFMRHVQPTKVKLDFDTLLRTSGVRSKFYEVMYAGHWQPDEIVDAEGRLGMRYPSVKEVTVMCLPIKFCNDFDDDDDSDDDDIGQSFHWGFILSGYLRICTHMFPNAEVTLDNSGRKDGTVQRYHHECKFFWHHLEPIFTVPHYALVSQRIVFKKRERFPDPMAEPSSEDDLVTGRMPLVNAANARHMLNYASSFLQRKRT